MPTRSRIFFSGFAKNRNPAAATFPFFGNSEVICAQFPIKHWDRIAAMTFGKRKSERVDFERGIPVHMMGIDGTWRRDCLMVDVSQTGARLCVEGSLEGLDLREFFLLLSSTGLAYRRCQLVRVAGDEIGVEFLARGKARKMSSTTTNKRADLNERRA